MDVTTVGEDNNDMLVEARAAHENVQDFLHADIVVPMHATQVPLPEELFELRYDLDGIVVQLMNLRGVIPLIHYLRLPLFTLANVKSQWFPLKKHFHLHGMSRDRLARLKLLHGATLALADGGYFLDVALYPKSSTDPVLMHPKIVHAAVVDALNQVVERFKQKLRELPVEELSRTSLRKTSFRRLDFMNVLPPDQVFLLNLLDMSFVEACPGNLCPVFTLRKFGMKSTEDIELVDLVTGDQLHSVSVHAACSIIPKEANLQVLWARAGLQPLIGQNNSVFCALGMFEAINVQSKLDGIQMDIAAPLANLFKSPILTFFQLYVDSPHLHVQFPFKHPVSGTIVTAGLSHPQFQKALDHRAQVYIDHMDDQILKMGCQLVCRVEQVGLFNRHTDMPAVMHARDFFSQSALCSLLRNHAVILPFSTHPGRDNLLSTLKECLTHFRDILHEERARKAGEGGFIASWRTFQAELALESMFFGHPLSSSDYQLTVSLGTCPTAENSATYHRGFIGLAPYNSAAATTCPPPLQHWTRDSVQVLRIERLFPLTEALGSSTAVVGEALLHVLLKDIFRRNENIPLTQLAGQKCHGNLKGSTSIQTLTENLATQDCFPAPFTFGRARVLVERTGEDVAQALRAGFASLHLRYFPDIKYREIRRAKRMYWKEGDFLELLETDKLPSLQAKAAALTGHVCTEMERRGLSYARNLQRYKDWGMPWMELSLMGLPKGIAYADALKVLTFLSSVGMLMNGEYISYNELKTLIQELPFPQSKMQGMQLLSNFSLPKMCGVTVWRLHESMPFKLAQGPPRALVPQSQKRRQQDREKEPQEMEQQPYEDVQAADVEEEHGTSSVAVTRCQVSASRWTEAEVQLIDTDPHKTLMEAFTIYTVLARQKGLLLRSRSAFKCKRLRIMEKK